MLRKKKVTTLILLGGLNMYFNMILLTILTVLMTNDKKGKKKNLS